MGLELNLPNTPQNVRADEGELFTQFSLIYEALRKLADNVTASTEDTTDDETSTPTQVTNTFNGIQVYIQNTSPGSSPYKYIWVETGLGSGGTQYKLWFWDGTSQQLIIDPFATTNVNPFQKGAAWDCGGAVVLIAADCKEINTRVQRSGTIRKWTILTEAVAGSVEFDVWKTTFAAGPPSAANSICSADYPSITAAVKGEKTDLSLWSSTTVNVGNMLTFKVRSVSTFTWVAIILDIQ